MKIGLKARRGGILVRSAFFSSLARKILPGNIPRTNFIEKRIKTTFSGNGVENRPRILQERIGWFEKWTKIGVSSAEKFHRNVANSRNFHTSSHMHSGKNSEKIGEWVGGVLNGKTRMKNRAEDWGGGGGASAIIFIYQNDNCI